MLKPIPPKGEGLKTGTWKLRPLIKYDEKLLGLILGFGKESSSAFKNMSLGEKADISFGIAGYKPKGCAITPVSFRGNPNSEEVKRLIEKYTREIQEIERVHVSDQFLITTLEALCSPH